MAPNETITMFKILQKTANKPCMRDKNHPDYRNKAVMTDVLLSTYRSYYPDGTMDMFLGSYYRFQAFYRRAEALLAQTEEKRHESLVIRTKKSIHKMRYNNNLDLERRNNAAPRINSSPESTNPMDDSTNNDDLQTETAAENPPHDCSPLITNTIDDSNNDDDTQTEITEEPPNVHSTPESTNPIDDDQIDDSIN